MKATRFSQGHGFEVETHNMLTIHFLLDFLWGLLLYTIYVALFLIVFKLIKRLHSRLLLYINLPNAKRRREMELAAQERQKALELNRARERDENQRRRAEEEFQNEADRLRRETARAECEMKFLLCAKVIEGRFSKNDLVEFFSKYMSERHPPEVVEHRGKQLIALLVDLNNSPGPDAPPNLNTVDGLARWFSIEKSKIESLPVDQIHRDTQLALLNAKYADMSLDLLENPKS